MGEGRVGVMSESDLVDGEAKGAISMADSQKPCVLVIDDHEQIIKYLRIHLEMWGFEVVVALTGAGGLEIAQSCPLTAVLVDITLPDIDGFAVGRALRQIPALAHTRFIAISGYDFSFEKDKLAAAGFEKCLQKPFNSDELQRLLFELKATNDKR
jgi:CheY-like chemotaxis protein